MLLVVLLLAACEPLSRVIPAARPPDAAPLGPLGGAGGFVPGGESDPGPVDAASDASPVVIVDAAPPSAFAACRSPLRVTAGCRPPTADC